MTHAERRAERKRRDAAGEIRVSWRHVSYPFVGLSGFGPFGLDALVYVREAALDGDLYVYGWNRGGLLEPIGTRGTIIAAKAAAEELFA